jgi:acyl-CoA reductase-like NAD-dependent aldehyde dehydrogenase
MATHANSGLCFDRSGRRLLALDATGVSVIEVATRHTTHLPCANARAVAGFDDQIWIATHELTRVDLAGRPLHAATPLPFAERGMLVAAPCGAPAAVWTATPPIALHDEAGELAHASHAHAHALLPITGRRCVVAVGSQLTLPSGLVVELAPGSTVVGGAALTDGKLMAVVIAHGSKRQLAVISLTSAQINFRHALVTGDVRIASARGVAVLRASARVLRTIDLRTGRELGTVALDRDVLDHAVDPDGRWLALRDAEGVELRDLQEARPVVTSAKPTTPVLALRRFAVSARGRFTHGQFVLPEHADNELTLRAPGTGEVLGVFPYDTSDVDAAVESAASATSSWAKIGLAARLGVLARIEQPLARATEDLCTLMQRELGRSEWECKRELAGLAPRTADLFAFAHAELEDATTGETRTRQRALGVVAVLSPVMLPLGTSHLHIVSALIAGNAVVWKPSPLVAASAQAYAEVLAAAGLPPGVFNLVHGGAEVGQRLVRHAGVDGVVCVGSRETAREVRRATCDRLDLALTLHTGSKNLAIVTVGADVEAAALAIAEAAFLTGGQRSTAIGRALVTSSLVEPMLAALIRCTRQLAARPGFIAPLFSTERSARHATRLEAAQAAGARSILHGDAESIHVLEDPACAADYAREELFGPDLLVEPVADLPAAIARLRGHSANYASLFGGDLDDWQQIRDDVDAGAVLWNHSPLVVAARLAFAPRGNAVRGSQAILAMTRRVADCRAVTGEGLPIELPVVVEGLASSGGAA